MSKNPSKQMKRAPCPSVLPFASSRFKDVRHPPISQGLTSTNLALEWSARANLLPEASRFTVDSVDGISAQSVRKSCHKPLKQALLRLASFRRNSRTPHPG